MAELPSEPPASDRIARLVVAARAGDHAAFGGLYQRFHRVVHAVVLARCRRGDEADLVQDVFAVAFEKLDSLHEPAAFPGWLLTIARRRASEGLKRRGMLRLVDPLDDAREPSVSPPPRSEANEALEAIRSLPPAYAETLLMRLVEDLSGPEIAERTGLTEGSVRVNLHRGMAMLREKLSSKHGVAEGGEP